MLLSNIEDIFSQIQDHVEQLEAAREVAIQKSRRIIRNCGTVIKDLHRGEPSRARKLLEEITQELTFLQSFLSNNRELNQIGNYLQTAEQEYVEATLFLSFMENKDLLPTPSELGVSVGNYLNGMADLIGELRRYCLSQLKVGNLNDAERAFNVMEELFDYLMSVEAANAVLQGLRRKIDSNRGVISRTREDLARARMMADFLGRFESLVEEKKNVKE